MYNLTMKINRLEMLKSLLDAALTSGFDQIHQVMEETMNTETYKQFERLAGILGPTVMDPGENVNAIVNGNFQGTNFSQRLWGSNQTALKNTLYSELSRGMVQGLSPKDLAKKLEGKFTQSQYAAERLLQTELTNCRMQANKKSIEDNGFEIYIFLPMKTACSICLIIKDNHYKLEDAEPGKNYPPMHPNCRCATAPYTDEKLYNEWLDTVRDHGLSFDEWKAERKVSEREEGHKNINRETQINRKYIESKEYRSCFDKLEESQKI